jgi:hypothetical protein
VSFETSLAPHHLFQTLLWSNILQIQFDSDRSDDSDYSTDDESEVESNRPEEGAFTEPIVFRNSFECLSVDTNMEVSNESESEVDFYSPNHLNPITEENETSIDQSTVYQFAADNVADQLALGGNFEPNYNTCLFDHDHQNTCDKRSDGDILFSIYEENAYTQEVVNDSTCSKCGEVSFTCGCEDDFSGFEFQSGTLPTVTTDERKIITERFGALDFQSFNLIKTTEFKWMVQLVEDVMVLVHMLSRCTNPTDLFVALATFAKLRTGDSLLYSPFFEGLKKQFQNFFPNLTLIDDDKMKFESEQFQEFLCTTRSVLDKYEEVKRSVLVQKLHKISMYGLAFSLFSKIGIDFDTLGYAKVQEEAIRRKFHMGTDFVHCLMDTLQFLAERGYQIYQSGSIDKIFHSGKSYEAWFDEVNLLKRQAVVLNTPEVMDFTESDFLNRLSVAIEKGDSIVTHASRLGDYEKKITRHFLEDLKILQAEILCSSYARQNRLPPFSVLVFGESGQGKSTVVDLICYHFAAKQGLNTGDEFTYTRNPVAKYWDGFKTSMHTVKLDDVAFRHPNSATNGDTSCDEFIQIINGVPFVPDQAALENKGKVPLRAKLVIATTNAKDLNARHYFSHPAAAQRRFPFVITPIPKPEYQGKGQMLDSKKVQHIPGQYPDLWDFNVEYAYAPPRCNPNSIGHSKVQYDTILEGADLPTFLKWLNGAIESHDLNQGKMLESNQHMKSVVLCDKCQMPEYLCECHPNLTQQSFGTIITHTSSTLNFIVNILYLIQLGFIITYITNLSNKFNSITSFAPFNYIRTIKKRFIYYTRNKNYALSREFWYDLGVKAQSKFNTPTFLLTLITLLSFGYILRKFMKTIFSFQGTSGSKPKPKEEGERENPWYCQEFGLTKFDVPSASLAHDKNKDELLKTQIQANTVCLTLLAENSSAPILTNAFCIRSNYYITTAHSIPNGIFKISVVDDIERSSVSSSRVFVVTPSQVVRDDKTQFAIIYLPQLPPKKDLSKYLNVTEKCFRSDGNLFTRNINGFLTTRNLTCLTLQKNVQVSNQFLDLAIAKASVKTQQGDCGGPVMVNTVQGPVITGVHVAGDGLRAASIIVTKQQVDDAIATFEAFDVQSGTPTLSSSSQKRELTTLSHKSVFRYMEDGDAKVYGSFGGFKRQPKSNVCNTLLHEAFVKEGYVAKYTAPQMKGWTPWRIAAQDLLNPVSAMRHDVLEECVESFTNDLLSGLNSRDLEMLEIYDDFTTINGCAGVAYVDKVKRQTSAGNPWKCSKMRFLTPDAPRGGNMDPVMVDDEIMTRVRDMIARYESGERCHPNFCAHLKDEPVKHAKRKLGKTRVFCGAPFDYTLVKRKYLLSFVRLVQNNRTLFESGPGTICQSKEWHDLYLYLTKFGDQKMIAGDYKAFDKRMASMLMLGAYKIIRTLCAKSGNYSPADLKVIEGLAMDTSFPLTDFNGDLVEFFGSNPSGHPLTVIVNGLCNSLYMRYCYRMLNPEHEVQSFKKNVALMTYGDDNAAGVSEDIPWYNHTAIASTLAEIGVTYTMADKDAESVPYIPMSEVSFLKRTWRMDEDVGYYLCPLEHESIEKSLLTWVSSKTVSAEEQMMSVMNSAVREYFYYGRKEFDKRRALFVKVIEENDLSYWHEVMPLPTWRECYDTWMKSSNLA